MKKNRFRGDYLELRYNTYYAIYFVPEKLRDLVGKTKYTKTTRTSDKRLALDRATAFVLQWKNEIAQLQYQTHDPFIASALDLGRQLKQSKDSGLKLIIRETIEEEHIKYSENLHDNPFQENFENIALGRTALLENLIPAWIDYEQNRGLAQKTVDQMRRDIVLLTGFFKTAGTLIPSNVRAWTSEWNEDLNLSPSAVQRVFFACRNLFKYLKEIQVIPHEMVSPFILPSEFKSTKRKHGKAGNKVDSWIAFKPKEVEKLYRQSLQNEDVILSHLIFIAAYTGARIEEICSLKINEINIEEEYFDIIDAKTRAGNRQVPIHSALKPLIEKLISQSHDGYLLSGLTSNKYGGRSNAIGKRFGRMKTKLEFPPLKVFHSIRKTVTTTFENSNIFENIAADIVGHDKPNMTYGLYSGGASYAVKKAALENLKYNFDLITKF